MTQLSPVDSAMKMQGESPSCEAWHLAAPPEYEYAAQLRPEDSKSTHPNSPG
jgi:hypothetical protein